MSKYGDRILKELDSRAPDLKEQIKAQIDWDSIKNSARPTKKAGFSLRRFAYAVCIVFVLAAIVTTATLLTPPPGGTTIVVSINPRVEFVLDKDIVVSQKALNEDGVTLLLNDDYVGMAIDPAVGKLLERAKTLGYLKDNKTVKLAVKYSNGKKAEKEYRELSELISGFLESNLKGASLAMLTEDELEDILDSYDEKELEGFKESQLLEFRSKLCQVINEKISATETLASYLTGQKNRLEAEGMEEDDKMPAEIRQEVNNNINAYLAKYPSELSALKSNAKLEDLNEIIEELDEITEELDEALEDINEGRQDDVKEQLEDLFEIAWELLNPEKDDD